MIKNSFCFFCGISESAESRLWQRGLRCWDDLALKSQLPFNQKKRQVLVNQIPFAKAAMDGQIISYFLKRLPTRHRVRILGEYIKNSAFIDIETTGLEKDAQITCIAVGMFDKNYFRVNVFVAGQGIECFLRKIKNVKLLVTYNGNCFDIPHLEHYFGIKLHIPHLDMRYVLSDYGLKGGQKAIEKRLGLSRLESAVKDGSDAVDLWEQYILHDNDLALNKLIAYNADDVYQLYKLCVWAYNQSVGSLVGLPKMHATEQMKWEKFSN